MTLSFPEISAEHTAARIAYLCELLKPQHDNAQPWKTLGEELASRTKEHPELLPEWWASWPTRPPTDVEDLALSLWFDVRAAVRATVLMLSASVWFAQEPAKFRSNPSNTLAYQALKHFEDRAVIRITEILKLHFPAVELRGRTLLALHRDLVCHPVTRKWGRKGRQEFYDSDHNGNSLRTAIIWDIRKSVNALLDLEGSRDDRLEGVEVDWELAKTLRLMLELSFAQGIPVPEPDYVFRYLQTMVPHVTSLLDEHPTGLEETRPLPAEL